ncbi:MAG: CheR family methyltransferase [Paracoccaceae bacterium]
MTGHSAARSTPPANRHLPGLDTHRLDIGEGDFETLASLIHQLSGIVIGENKRLLLISRLRKRLAALRIHDFGAYLELLKSPQGEHETREFINAMSTNLTGFFREAHHFRDVVDELRNGIATQPDIRRARIWSAACSTGEEPYSIAMALMRSGLMEQITDLRILATDIDTNVLQTARDGVFSARQMNACAKETRLDCFDSLPDGRFRIVAPIRRLIVFNQLNLQKRWPMKGPMDAIFCRNVLIYFDDSAKHAIVERMVKLLRPGGTLYLGHSEALLGNNPALERRGQCIFRKKE